MVHYVMLYSVILFSYCNGDTRDPPANLQDDVSAGMTE